MKYREKPLFFGLFLGFLGILLSHTYRQYIYVNNFFDFHIADTIGSIICVPSYSLFIYGLGVSKISFQKLVILSFFAFVLYEFVTILPFHGTFDLYDLGAMVISTSLTLLIYRFFRKKG